MTALRRQLLCAGLLTPHAASDRRSPKGGRPAVGDFVGVGRPAPNRRHSGTEERVKQILSSNQIRDGVRQLAEQITAIYGGRPLTIGARAASKLLVEVVSS